LCARPKTVPSIRPITSSVRVAAIGNVFSKGRDSAAWLGLMPHGLETAQISKRGNRYPLVLFVQTARVVLIRPQSWERHGLKP
jgi:transposase